MNPGKLNRRITFCQLVDQVNELNQDVQDLQEIKTVWANIIPLKGKEYFEAKRTEHSVDHKIVTRYHSWMKPDMIIRCGKREFEIESVINVNDANYELNIMVREVVIRNGGQSDTVQGT